MQVDAHFQRKWSRLAECELQEISTVTILTLKPPTNPQIYESEADDGEVYMDDSPEESSDVERNLNVS